MFRRQFSESERLFSKHDLGASLQLKRQYLQSELESLDQNRFLNTSPADLANYFAQKYGCTAITLLREQWSADVEEAQVDVRYDPRRWIQDKSRPFYMPGERTTIRIPFTGEPDLFHSRSNTWSSNPPRAIIEGNELILVFESPADSPIEVRPLVDEELARIEECLKWQADMISGHNHHVLTYANDLIQQRRQRILEQSQRAEALGIPIRRRDDAPQTYAVPATRRQAAPSLPPATTAKFAPEPTWAMEQYEQAIKIMQDMTLVMERSPAAFKTMDEEAIRQHFLVQLNGQFEGKASGETFNMGGKTDILLREGDRNVFIAECKFWKGPKKFGEAIDQLLGYSTWRDSKAAILVFNRGTDTSTVLAGVQKTMKEHANFKREFAWGHESGFRYVLHNNEDKNREIIVTVLVFHVPD